MKGTYDSTVDVKAIERPTPQLWKYYILRSFTAGAGFPVLLVILLARYRTLHYRFDDQGISAAWGRLFHREVHVTYARIQDIHLRSNVVERWFGLARIEIQTASGSAKAELTIEGVEDARAVRDFLYGKMRGVRLEGGRTDPRLPSPEPDGDGDKSSTELAAALREVAAELRALRGDVEAQRGDVPKRSDA